MLIRKDVVAQEGLAKFLSRIIPVRPPFWLACHDPRQVAPALFLCRISTNWSTWPWPSDGESESEAIVNARDAFSAWMSARAHMGKPIPRPTRHGETAAPVRLMQPGRVGTVSGAHARVPKMLANSGRSSVHSRGHDGPVPTLRSFPGIGHDMLAGIGNASRITTP